MFEKFTEKALQIVTGAQKLAEENNFIEIYPEHILIAFIAQKSCFSTKLLSMSKISLDKVVEQAVANIENKKSTKKVDIIGFSEPAKLILKNSFDLAKQAKSGSITTEHLFLSMIKDINSPVSQLLGNLDFDTEKAKTVLGRLFEKRTKKNEHPEGILPKRYESEEYSKVLSIIEEPDSKSIFDHAVAKLTASNYEILGTEQIVQSILEDSNSDISKILAEYGINLDSYGEKLKEMTSRTAEYEEKQIIFTPNAFKTILLAIETAKELGEATVKPEHIILGVIKAKSGIAYNIFKGLKVNDDDLAHRIIKPIEKQMPETLTILRLAKNEARRLGRNIVGSELILLGIIAESVGIGATVLSKLGINIKDARNEVEKLIGYGDKYSDTEIIFSKRAKLILERAAKKAKKHNLKMISSANLLWAITKEPTSLAMRVLENLGADTVEITQGILKELHEC
ncbi:hypothetical protein IJE86_06300 [bacterium]|nr:hypothetical protein [bacterium]